MTNETHSIGTRKMIYGAMILVLVAIFVGAYRGAPPVYLAVGFIGEIILVSTAHLSAMIQRIGVNLPGDRQFP